MNQKPDSVPRPRTQSETERELFSDKKHAFIDALECLYIPNNAGARGAFSEKWPDAAFVLFDDELVRFDYNGVNNDEERTRRAELEMMSEDRRLQMLELFENVEKRLVHHGSLQLEALNALMAELNRPIAEYIFAERFVNKYFPVEGHALGGGQVDANDQSSSEAKERTTYGYSPSAILSTSVKPGANRPIVRNIVNVSDLVPESPVDTIGHVDHSYNASAPSYSNVSGAQEEEDMSWLNATEEDELGNVKPISVGETHIAPKGAAPLPEAISSLSSTSSSSTPPHMEAVRAPQTTEQAGYPDTLSTAPAQPAAQEENTLPPGIAQVQQPRRPLASGSADDGVAVSGYGSVSGSLSGISFEKRADTSPSVVAAPAAPQQSGATAPVPPAASPENQGAVEPPPQPAVKKDEPPAPRVPRLEDLDKHVPPIPGTDEDDRSGRF